MRLSICESPNVLEIMNIVVTIIKVIMVVVPNIVAAVLIILVPVLVSLIVTISFPESDYAKCISDISSVTIQEAYEDKAESLVRKAEETLNINDYTNAMNYLSNVKDDAKRESYEERLAEVKRLIDEAKLDNTFPIKIASFCRLFRFKSFNLGFYSEKHIFD